MSDTMSLSNREWKEYKFSDFVDISPTVSLKGGIDYSFIEMKDLQDGSKYCIPSAKRTLSGGARFAEGDTLFARITPCLENGKICKVKGLENGVGFGSTEFLIFRGKENISDNDFVFYLSRWDEVRGFAESNFEGTSGRQRVPKNCFDNLHLDLPSVTEQKSIATILSSLDDKIDLLHRQNKTLEKLAETFFRQWFLEEAGESWEEVKLKTLCEIITKGTTPTTFGKQFVSNGINFLKVESLTEDGEFIESKFAHIDLETDKLLSRSRIKTNDVLITIAGTIGRVAIVPERIIPANTNQAIAIIRVNIKILDPVLIYLLLKSPIVINDFESRVVHAVQPNLSLGEIGDIGLRLPPKELLIKFSNEINLVFNKKEKNNIKILTLTQLRDTLLPKLMSGEVRVEN